MASHLWIRWDSPAAGHLPHHLRTLRGLGHLGLGALAALGGGFRAWASPKGSHTIGKGLVVII